MKSSPNLITITVLTIYTLQCQAKILRNNALMTRMVSNFHKDQSNQIESAPPKVLGLMQSVLCKNFPTIPCDIIVRDEKLKHLIEKSIQQIQHKKQIIDKTTSSPGYQLTLYPNVNSEELTNFLSVKDTGYFLDKKSHRKSKPSAILNPRVQKFSKMEKNTKEKRKAIYNGRTNMRKFYPHKVKYNKHNSKKDLGDFSGEKLSMSVEVPDMTLTKKHQHYAYRREPDNPPVWRIDYMKHGEPSLNIFGYSGDQLEGKIMKSGPNVIVDENVLAHAARKEVLHPDVYIKKKNNRNLPVDINSEGTS